MLDPRFVAASAVALTVTLVAIFSLRPLAPRLGLIDKPSERKRHRGRVPLIGGLCFFLGTLAGLLYLGYFDRFVVLLLLAGALILLTGLIDDMRDLSARSRLAIQIGVVGLVIAFTGVHIDNIGSFMGQELRLHALGIPVTIIAVVGLMNAFNMIDGVDGLAGCLALVCIVAAMAFAQASWSTLSVLMLLQILFVALLPYLGVNLGWPDGRKIFMGDAGSTTIGFLLAWSLIFMSQRSVAVLSPTDVLWCVALPVFDTLAVIVRRMRAGYSPFKADRKHLHHLLLDAGCPPRAVLALMVSAGGGLATTGYVLRNAPDVLNFGLYLSLLTAYVSQVERVIAWLSVALRSSLTIGGKVAVAAGAARDAQWAEPALDDRAVVAPEERESEPGESLLVEASAPPVRVLCVVSAASEAVGIAPVLQRLYGDKRFEAQVCVIEPSGRKPEQIVRLFNIASNPKLDIVMPDRGRIEAISAAFGYMKRVIRETQPHVVLVHADTATTLAVTSAAYSQRIPVARFGPEAGSERFDARDGETRNAEPRDTDAPPRDGAATSVREMRRPGATAPMFAKSALMGRGGPSAWRTNVARLRRDAPLRQRVAQRFDFLRHDAPLVLVVHDGKTDGLEHVGRALRRVASQRQDVDFAYAIRIPMDASPRTRSLLWRLANGHNAHLVEPLDDLSFAYLLDNAYLVLTSSQEVEESAGRLSKPVMLVRGDSELGMAIEGDGVQQGRIQERALADGVMTLLTDRYAYEAMCSAHPCTGGSDDCLQTIAALARSPFQAPMAA